jgi:serine/threonine protein kinase
MRRKWDSETAVTKAESTDSHRELRALEIYDAADPRDWCAGKIRRAAKQNTKSSIGGRKQRFFTVPSIILPQDFEKSERQVSGGGESDCSTTASSNDSSSSLKVEMKSITVCKHISDFYLLGCDIAKPNSHRSVHKARRVSDSLEVVIKKRDKCKSNDPSKQHEIEQEEQEWRRSAIMLLNLPKHDTIAQLFEVLEDPDAYYVVMEKVKGVDLYEALHSDVRITIEEARAILYRLLEAVQDLHDNGCIHKDLKLENVMLDSPQILDKNPWESPESSEDYIPLTVKIIDFDTVEAFSPKMISKRVVGTDQYIAQEAYGGHYSPASDMFSVGVMAFHLISGKFPFWNMKFDDWPGENRAGSVKMREIQDRLKTYSVNYDMEPWPDLPLAKDLVSSMLQTNQVERVTLEQALAHPFFEPVWNSPRSQKPLSQIL